MNSLINKIKKKGLKGSAQMISVKFKKTEKKDKCKISREKEKAIDHIFNDHLETILIFENHFGYYNIMLQRPQHITRALSDAKTLVLYNSYYNIDFEDQSRITNIQDNYYVLDLYYYRNYILNKVCESNLNKKVMVYSTDTVPVERIKQYDKLGFDILYEYVDDINPDLIQPQKLEMIMNRHHYLVHKEGTQIIATADRLYEEVLKENEDANVHLISNGVECGMFPPNVKTADVEYVSWLKQECIKVGYYGALANWIDYDMLKELVKDKNIQLILIGVKHDDSLEQSGLLQNENVKYFGKKPYDQLAEYANNFDVCIIPFLINDITLSTSPVKLFEYMAMEKPVVTTPMPECMKYDVVKIANDAHTFREKIYEAAEQSKDIGYKSLLRKCAYDNDWTEKAKKIKESCF